jgi:hypothetical protein
MEKKLEVSEKDLKKYSINLALSTQKVDFIGKKKFNRERKWR